MLSSTALSQRSALSPARLTGCRLPVCRSCQSFVVCFKSHYVLLAHDGSGGGGGGTAASCSTVACGQHGQANTHQLFSLTLPDACACHTQSCPLLLGLSWTVEAGAFLFWVFGFSEECSAAAAGQGRDLMHARFGFVRYGCLHSQLVILGSYILSGCGDQESVWRQQLKLSAYTVFLGWHVRICSDVFCAVLIPF